MSDSESDPTIDHHKTARPDDDATIDYKHSQDKPSAESDTIGTPPSMHPTSSDAGHEIQDFGDYELLEEVARGGMGVVFRARQKSLNRIVAVKMILAGQLASKDDVTRFETEAQAAAKLDHPGIVPIYEIGNRHGQHFFSMAFVDGISLSDRIKGQTLTPIEAAQLMIKIVDAIAFAHDKGVIHRDLKPANILLDQDGNPRVTDFGLAKSVDQAQQMTMTGQALGTPGYMSPEQASGRASEATVTTDVYSLGAVLYSILVGHPPFKSDTVHETLAKVIKQEPVSPRDHDHNIPRDLETICLKCLEKEPAKRFASAADLADELKRFVAGTPIHSRAISGWERIWRWRKIIKNNKDVRLRSRRKLLGLPLVDIAFGEDPDTNEKTGHAKGWLALGDKATGVVAIGGFARGLIAYGKITLGFLAIGAFSFGVFATGLTAIGVFTAGGLSVGFVSLGLIGLGYYSMAWLSIGKSPIGFWRIGL